MGLRGITGWDLIQAIVLTKRLYDEYESNPAAVAYDLLALISRVATLHKVPLKAMLEAVERGARLPRQ